LCPELVHLPRHPSYEIGSSHWNIMEQAQQSKESILPHDEDDSSDDDYSLAHESFTDDGTGDEQPQKRKNKGQEANIAKQESRAVHLVRFLVIILLLAVTGGVAYGVYYYVNEAESDDFQEDFEDSSEKVLDAVGSVLDQSLGAIDNFMVSIVSNAKRSENAWPYVVIPDFAVRAAKVLSLSKASVFGVYPKVSAAERPTWEQWALENDGWVDDSLRVQREDPTFSGVNVDSWYPADSISGYQGPLPVDMPGPHYPTYQAAPIVPIFSAYGWDLYQPFQEELNTMESERVVTMGRTLNLPSNAEELAEQPNTINWISGIIGPDLDPTEPLVAFYYPIVENATSGVAVAESDPQNHKVVGVIAMTIFWRELLQNILSPGSDGMMVVIGSDCNQTFTYQIFGPTAKFVGRGDLHDPEHSKMTKFTYLHNLGSYSLRGRSYTGFPLSQDLCPYWLKLYASDTMQDEHETNNPLIFTIVAVSIFVFTSLVFCLYDCVSERRQRKVLRVAVQSTAVVSSLFPQVVRDRIFPTNQQSKQKSADRRVENAKLRLQQFLRSDGDGDEPEQSPGANNNNSNAPIAELFSDTTVMFADIAGFTAWSSVREPAQVFTLLETLYGAFDRIAQRRGVFKVETIGDSYVAVTGLPEPRVDHAIVMAKFARDCRERMTELTEKLGTTLGPDTSDLQLRIGLNSGPVTAGVLRGERSRFQLFGDTVNTAARMESTGVVSKIQVSQSTADLLKKAGKSHWVTKREGEVEAKGKGKIQTYFVDPSGRGGNSVSSGEETIDDDEFQVMDDKTRRLVDWNVEILTKLIKQVVARREAWESVPRKKGLKTQASSNSNRTSSRIEQGTVLEEVKEVIELPDYDDRLSQAPANPASIELNTAVMTQLREYVSLIASMYHGNPFHCFEHASHVTMSVVKLLSRIVAPSDRVIRTTQDGKAELASTLHDHTYGITSDPLTQFACVFAALIHDVDHQGVPNTTLLAEDSPLVTTYKGKSMAEQNSVDISWKLLMEDQFEDLRNIICPTSEEMTRFRQLVVNSVMATDIMDKDLKTLRNQRWEKAFSEGSRLGESQQVNTNRKATIVIEHLIQASDVAHTMQHWHIFRKWNEKLFCEMYEAYRAGRSDKNPAEFWYKGEIGFFDFYIIPLAKKLSDCGVFGVSSDEYLSYAMKNREEWEHRGQEVVANMLTKFEVPDEVVGTETEYATTATGDESAGGPAEDNSESKTNSDQN